MQRVKVMKKVSIVILIIILIFATGVVDLLYFRQNNNTFLSDLQKSHSTDTNSNDPISKDGKLNINTASAEELTMLNGIGEAIASRIVAYRTENGYFNSIDEIINVKGIGQAKFEEIQNFICVG